MISRAKIEKFVEEMAENKYLATLFLIKRVSQLQERQEKLIAGSQRFMVEQAIDEFLEKRYSFELKKPATVNPIINEDILMGDEDLNDPDPEQPTEPKIEDPEE